MNPRHEQMAAGHGMSAITAHGMSRRQRISPHATVCCTAVAGAVRLCGAAAAARRRARNQRRCAPASAASPAHSPARRRPPRLWVHRKWLFSPQLGSVLSVSPSSSPMPSPDMDLCCLLHAPTPSPSDLVTQCADLLQRGPSFFLSLLLLAYSLKKPTFTSCLSPTHASPSSSSPSTPHPASPLASPATLALTTDSPSKTPVSSIPMQKWIPLA